MSWSLKVKNGDLSLNSASYETTHGAAKLVQDLRLAFIEAAGTDLLHPEFGSFLDGGMRTDGTYMPGIIGQTDPTHIRMFVEAEVRRVCDDYQQRQLLRAKNDRFTYGKTTLLAGEILQSVDSVDVFQNGTGLLIRVGITTLAGTKANLDLDVV